MWGHDNAREALVVTAHSKVCSQGEWLHQRLFYFIFIPWHATQQGARIPQHQSLFVLEGKDARGILMTQTTCRTTS